MTPTSAVAAPMVVNGLRRGTVGGMLGAGEVVLTASGRECSPFPKIDLSTERKALRTLQRVDAWLLSNAIEEAKARGDSFNWRNFCQEDPKALPPASKDAMEEYLFGESQPPIPRPFLRPFPVAVGSTR